MRSLYLYDTLYRSDPELVFLMGENVLRISGRQQPQTLECQCGGFCDYGELRSVVDPEYSYLLFKYCFVGAINVEPTYTNES